MFSVFSEMCAKELRALVRDPAVPIVLFMMPLILVVVIGSSYDSLVLSRDTGADRIGLSFAVPGFALLFTYYIIDFLGRSVFDERISGTWDRIRQLNPHALPALVGKSLPFAILAVAQLAFVLAIGFGVFQLPLGIDWLGLGLLVLSIAINIVGISLLFVSFCSSPSQVTAYANLIALGSAAIGGSIVPTAAMHPVLQIMAHATPHYWAMRGFDQLLRQGSGLTALVPGLAILAGSGVLCIVVAALRLRRSLHL